MSKNVIFISEQLFKERTGASNQIDPRQIIPIIKVAQDIHIQPALGSKFYRRLQDGIELNNLNNNESGLIDNYITDALVWFTMSMLPMAMGYQLFSKGFLIKQSEESQAPSQKDLELIEQKYLSIAEFYKTRLITYLKENDLLFPDYYFYETTLDAILPETQAYTCPIYIGDRVEPMVYASNQTLVNSMVAYFITVGGETSFQVPAIVGFNVFAAFRSGLNKIITDVPTSNSQYLTINNGLITLPTGDIAQADETFTFLYR